MEKSKEDILDEDDAEVVSTTDIDSPQPKAKANKRKKTHGAEKTLGAGKNKKAKVMDSAKKRAREIFQNTSGECVV